MKKFTAVWENRFFEQVNQCSERIPGKFKFVILTSLEKFVRRLDPQTKAKWKLSIICTFTV